MEWSMVSDFGTLSHVANTIWHRKNVDVHFFYRCSAHTHIHMYVCIYIHAYIHTHIHTYKHTYIHTYICIRMSISL